MDQVGQVNPPKFDCSDDMSSLTYLNDACVLWNSVVRYKNELIYTYSGLFCIAINPYKRFPIYTQRTMEIYIGMRRFVIYLLLICIRIWIQHASSFAIKYFIILLVLYLRCETRPVLNSFHHIGYNFFPHYNNSGK